MLTQGADDINGDAYLPNYEGGSTINPEYQPAKYYDYAVEMPAGSSNGQVFIYDPVFCATSSNGQYGTGDRWFGSATPTSSFFQLWDTKNTPFDLTDDTRVDPTGDDNLFRRIQASDTTLNGPATGGSTVSCAQGATSDTADGRVLAQPLVAAREWPRRRHDLSSPHDDDRSELRLRPAGRGWREQLRDLDDGHRDGAEGLRRRCDAVLLPAPRECDVGVLPRADR